MIDFSKFPKDLKSILINTIMFPFWYISIYMLNKDLYYSGDYLLITSICICFTFISYTLSSFISIDVLDELKDKWVLDYPVIITSIFIQVSWLSIILFSCYLANIFTGSILYFHSFLIIYFGVLLFRFYVFNSERKDKEKEKLEQK